MNWNSIRDILDKARRQYPALSKRLEEAQALSRWELAVGPAIARHSRAIRVQDGVLWVEVDHPIWKSELHHRKRQILEILNQGRGPSPDRRALEPLSPKEVLSDILFLDPRR